MEGSPWLPSKKSKEKLAWLGAPCLSWLSLGLNFIDPYLQSITSNFEQGANFAGATVEDVTYLSPFTLTYQVKQFVEFHDNVQAQRTTNPGDKSKASSTCPHA
ncbi:unnamed protein product [Calypogeia fissa]